MTGSPASVHVLALAGYLVLLGFLAAVGPVRAQPADGPVLQFDIAAQNLGDALDIYSRRTGIAVLMDQRYAQRQSAAVRGAHAAGAALQSLLEGTGLQSRLSDAQAVIVYAPAGAAELPQAAVVAAADIPGATQGGGDHAVYVSRLQHVLLGLLCRAAQTRPGGYRLALQLYLNRAGVVDRVHLLDSTGLRARDTAIARVVLGMRVGVAPLPSMPQPVSILLLPQGPGSEVDCASSMPGSNAP
ncbi:hypothetical protein [Janthinobacterium lividum]|uniref:hypothetical protein n=1 Tax=Janthinobacterium lividum TaxID=29581 RepID=UPI000892C9F7|nr:hypothetical protein [Janthinobacterium lividum]MCC7713061.1 hypothetical protein [Janthinobacterium lividum]OEZ57419.1 hypothetical protein JANLI_25460 [Janthinobacterium lividum]WQE31495.1 hypothetical protein U0004_14105 [Janthinobacterium lividum]STQ97023.1 Outer membrane receptor for ferric coprogen and ferric-rhodotorulic acid [Janthinobacterium lividum]